MNLKLLFFTILCIVLMAISANAQNYAVQLTDVGTRIAVDIQESSTDWTFESWIYLDEIMGDYTGIIDARASEEPGASALVLRNLEDRQFLGYEWGGAWDFADGPDIPIGEWCHVAIVVSSSSNMSFMYLNGMEFASDDAYNGLGEDVLLGMTRIGNSNDMDERALIGMMDEVRIWNVERTADEIYDNMDKSVEFDSPGLIVQYKCDGIDGDAVLIDECGNYDAEIIGDVYFMEADILTSRKEIKTDKLNVYPTFARDMVSIQGLEKGASVRILNTSGQVISSHLANSVQLQVPVKSLNSGIYIVETTIMNEVHNARFIKE